ncbi:hypothetical protein U1E44_11380 [Arenibacter sp. GZD96]|uniref:hypothetical protein n=1 Tax=Aurantibrevibacter litoralis TaxID=3106030 RepID=UPI002AFF0286|nr:hypothetical protein [Arenibacter sp. GZD-96]MEA1786696.1 hypothetical protein [Arenibacter sp. GZD-96]
MNKKLLILLTLLGSFAISAQDDDRRPLRGQVLYRNIFVPNENVINTTSERATITNEDGEFLIGVKLGDELVFTSVNYQLEVVKITEEILKKNRLVVEVNEKVTQLDEVVVSPEDQARFLVLQNESFKQYDYEIDRATEVENVAMPASSRGLQYGLNFVNLFKALTKAKNQEESEKTPLKLSDVLRQVYDDEFFITDLHLPKDQINDFLFYCDAKLPTQELLKKSNEFELIEFLVNHSKIYLTNLNAEK